MPATNHHSPRVSALLGKPPSWLVRWGTVVIFTVIALLLIGAAIVRYPEVIRAPITLVGSHPPQKLLAQQGGRFDQFFKPDGEIIESGTLIASLETEAKVQHIKQLDSLLKAVEQKVYAVDSSLAPRVWPLLKLGALQVNYERLQITYQDYQIFLAQKNYALQLSAYRDKQLNLNFLYQRSWQQRMTMQEQYNLAQSRYRTDSGLTAKGVYAQQELVQRKENLLQLEFALHGARANLAQLNMQKADLKSLINDVRLKAEQEKAAKALAVKNSLEAAKQALQTWYLNYSFKAKIAGKLNYETIWAAGQNVAAGQVVFTIVPQEANTLKGILLVPAARRARVEENQKVQIKLDAYPYEAFGFLPAQISKINSTTLADAEGNPVYVAEVQLNGTLQTTFGQDLQALSELTGVAEIITQELSLLERIFYSLRKLLD